MKWYLHTHYQLHLNDLKVKRDHPIEEYLPWVSQIANTFPRDGVAIGALNYQDLLQAGYTGLVDGWNNLDHDRGQAEKWAYLKKRIKWAIRREIDNYGAFIKVSRRQLEDHRNKLTGVDKILVNSFPKFFSEIEPREYDSSSWENEQLSILIENYLRDNYKTWNVNILLDSFGIDKDKALTYKELAKKYNRSEIGVRKVKERLINNLKKDETFIKIIENYLEK